MRRQKPDEDVSRGTYNRKMEHHICKGPVAGRGRMSLRNRKVVRVMEVSIEGLMARWGLGGEGGGGTGGDWRLDLKTNLKPLTRVVAATQPLPARPRPPLRLG